MSYRLRPALASDGGGLAAMARRCFVETHGTHFAPENLEPYLDRTFGAAGLPAEIGDPAYRVMLVEEGNEIAGFIKLAAVDLPVDCPPAAIEIRQLYVDQRWHGKSVGPILMAWAISTARAEGAPAILLSVWSQNGRAIAFYRRHGFKIIGSAPFQVGTHVDLDPVMRLDLAASA